MKDNKKFKTQVIMCFCGEIFAACVEPHCYIDKDWQKDLRKWASKGYSVALVDSCRFGTCKCKKEEKETDQLRVDFMEANGLGEKDMVNDNIPTDI